MLGRFFVSDFIYISIQIEIALQILRVWSETDSFYKLYKFWEIFCFSFFRRCATKRFAELADASLSKCGILSLSKCSISRQEKKWNRLKRIYFNFVVFPTRHYSELTPLKGLKNVLSCEWTLFTFCKWIVLSSLSTWFFASNALCFISGLSFAKALCEWCLSVIKGTAFAH